MLDKMEKDNKIMMHLINHHKKTTEAAKNKMIRDVQMLNVFITIIL
jgi:succinate dehydrogenase flavin-adding protein (antitoxin of CptAB toxin-antitoxin module)